MGTMVVGFRMQDFSSCTGEGKLSVICMKVTVERKETK